MAIFVHLRGERKYITSRNPPAGGALLAADGGHALERRVRGPAPQGGERPPRAHACPGLGVVISWSVFGAQKNLRPTLLPTFFL